MVELLSQYICAVSRKEQILATERAATLQLPICAFGIAKQKCEIASISDIGSAAKERRIDINRENINTNLRRDMAEANPEEE